MKILITVEDTVIASRFDLTTEVIIVECDGNLFRGELRTILLPNPNAEALCDLIVKERIEVLLCGAIEENFYHFLAWKKIKIFDFIIGSHAEALEMLISNMLQPRAVLPSANSC